MPRTGKNGRPRLLRDGSLLILAYLAPPAAAGPAFVLDALLAELDLTGTCIITGRVGTATPKADGQAFPGATVLRYDVPWWWPQRDRWIGFGSVRIFARPRALGNVLVALRVAGIAGRVARQRRLRAILAIYPKQHFLLAGLLASMIARVPLVVYFMDVYTEGLKRGRRIARLIEKLALRRAVLVFGMSGAHVRHLEARCRALGQDNKPIVELPHPYAELGRGPQENVLEGYPAIVFSGAIYDAQADAVARLIAALNAPILSDLDPQLYIYSQSDERTLAQHGISAGPRVHIARADRATVRAAQRAADLLFLPIAFSAPEQVRRTASPSKMPEYLAAGRPILVHAPPDSYLARYAIERRFAEVVTRPDIGALATAVHRLASDPAEAERRIAEAAKTLQRHEVSRVADELRIALDKAVSGGNPGSSSYGGARR